MGGLGLTKDAKGGPLRTSAGSLQNDPTPALVEEGFHSAKHLLVLNKNENVIRCNKNSKWI